MNHDLEPALALHRWWRDVGNDILLIGVLAEFLIDVLWPERPEIFPLLRGRRATRPFLRWYAHLLAVRGIIVVVVGLAVFAGIALERWQGTKADEIADQIRTEQQTRIADAEDRARYAQRDATQSNERAANAEKEAAASYASAKEAESHLAEANARAAEASERAAELEAVTYGKPLSAELKKAVADSCKNFPSREVIIETRAGDGVGEEIGLEVIPLLSDCKLKVGSRFVMNGAPSIGVLITGRPDDPLFISLRKGLSANRELLVVGNPEADGPQAIQIFIGWRPFMPPLSSITPEFLNRFHLRIHPVE